MILREDRGHRVYTTPLHRVTMNHKRQTMQNGTLIARCIDPEIAINRSQHFASGYCEKMTRTVTLLYKAEILIKNCHLKNVF